MKCELKIIKKHAFEMTLQQWTPFLVSGVIVGFIAKFYVMMYGGFNILSTILFTFLIIAIIMLYIFAKRECNQKKKIFKIDDLGISYPARNWLKKD